jgi:membrane protein DedA with SNARE-associated domain
MLTARASQHSRYWRPMLGDLFLQFGYVMVFVASAIEGDATLLTATYLAHRGYLRIDLVILAAMLGSIAVNQIYFRAARHYGQSRVADLRRRPVYGRVFTWIARFEVPLILASRFIWGFRIAIPVVCGATGISPTRFTAGDVIGAVIWSVVVGTAGWMMGQALEHSIADLRRYEWWIVGVLTVIALVIAGFHWRAWRAVRPKPDGAPD